MQWIESSGDSGKTVEGQWKAVERAVGKAVGRAEERAVPLLLTFQHGVVVKPQCLDPLRRPAKKHTRPAL